MLMIQRGIIMMMQIREEILFVTYARRFFCLKHRCLMMLSVVENISRRWWINECMNE
jgi:hypothetical protein